MSAVKPATLVVLTNTPITTGTSTPTPSPTPSPSPTFTVSPARTSTRTPQPTSTSTQSPLEMFSTGKLRNGVMPSSYLQDQCTYLQNRWSPAGSMPGTVVLPIMFHTIAENGTVLADPSRDITVNQFMAYVAYAQSLGFKTITTQELLDFLQTNARIPPRSMMIIIDDRRPGTIRDRIMPVLEEANWTVTSAYIADPFELLSAWNLMDQLYLTGRLDVQSHGYTGKVYIMPNTPLDQVQKEIWNSTDVLKQHFGVRPIAFIWPGGDFTPLSVEIARQGGYELGFTAYSRGPLMYNWIPLGEPEREVNDPLMVLPRAWSSAANVNMDEAVAMSKQAAEFADQNFEYEATWYSTYCGGRLENGW